jgi:AraC-like DNA-binding protein
MLAALGDVAGLAVSLAPLNSVAPDQPLIANGVVPLCRLIQQSLEGQCACRKFLARVSGRCERNPTTGVHRCFTGLIELAAPITVQGQPVAVLLCGEFFGRNPAVRDFAQCRRRLQQFGVRVECSRLRSAFFKSPVVPPARIRATGRLMAEIAGHLGELAAHCFFERRAEDPPCVAFAKALVAGRPEDMPSTRNAAHGAQVTEPYFCRTFKAATGMSFSQYVARSHVDQARELLRDPKLRITEVAYAAGFQSIPHFNHTFKRYTGMSPNGYRASLRNA